ncbi:MAG: hypothetical protein CR966_00965 [Pseudomonadales bacterium]|nr:MAG: hypothetical protein CR966_00965 [Pseudomonadales bacterium]
MLFKRMKNLFRNLILIFLVAVCLNYIFRLNLSFVDIFLYLIVPSFLIDIFMYSAKKFRNKE